MSSMPDNGLLLDRRFKATLHAERQRFLIAVQEVAPCVLSALSQEPLDAFVVYATHEMGKLETDQPLPITVNSIENVGGFDAYTLVESLRAWTRSHGFEAAQTLAHDPRPEPQWIMNTGLDTMRQWVVDAVDGVDNQWHLRDSWLRKDYSLTLADEGRLSTHPDFPHVSRTPDEEYEDFEKRRRREEKAFFRQIGWDVKLAKYKNTDWHYEALVRVLVLNETLRYIAEKKFETDPQTAKNGIRTAAKILNLKVPEFG